MFGTTSRLLLAVVIIGIAASVVGAPPAAASSKTGNFILGLAAGAILGAALSQNDNCQSGYYCAPPPVCVAPPPVYCAPPPVYVVPPPAYYYRPAPRVYVEGYYAYPQQRCAPRYYAPRPRCR